MKTINDGGRKKISAINAYALGSTGKIMQGIGHVASKCGYDVQMFSATNAKPMYSDSNINEISSSKTSRFYTNMNKLTGMEGCFAIVDTIKLIKKIDEYQPQIIHLHNLHHGYINLPILFNYLKKKQVKVVWTLHDCWAFTGHCPHFAYEQCEKWKSGCYSCPRYRLYPKSIFDNSRFIWKWKKRWFSGINNLIIVTPSIWLANMVSQSFLQNYAIQVIHNGIDLEVFKPYDNNCERYDIKKKIILGVSFEWSEKKGIDIFIELSKRLPNEYQIILVGTNDEIDKILPNNIISIHRTDNQNQLAEIYSLADVYVNPTREDNYPTVNMEAIACGTPVVTFRTGGSPESIIEGITGYVIDCNDIEAMDDAIKKACALKKQMKKNCIEQAKKFDMNDRFAEYIELYERLLN